MVFDESMLSAITIAYAIIIPRLKDSRSFTLFSKLENQFPLTDNYIWIILVCTKAEFLI